MFLLRYTETPGGTRRIVRLSPQPTEVDYPEGLEYTEKKTPDGASLFFRPRYDVRPRVWRWVDYPERVAAYESQWQTLRGLEVRARTQAGFPPEEIGIEVWEDDSGVGGFGAMLPGHEGQAPDVETGSNVKWTKVLVSNVSRTPSGGAGGARFRESVFEFRPADPTFSLL